MDLALQGIAVKDEPGRDPLPSIGSRPTVAHAAVKVKQEHSGQLAPPTKILPKVKMSSGG